MKGATEKEEEEEIRWSNSVVRCKVISPTQTRKERRILGVLRARVVVCVASPQTHLSTFYHNTSSNNNNNRSISCLRCVASCCCIVVAWRIQKQQH